MEKNSAIKVLKLLIDELNIPVTHKSIEDEIEKHPEHYSLLAISDILKNWRIPNIAYELTLEELIAEEVSTPFIAHLLKDKGEFVLVKKIDKNHLIVSNDKWNNQHLSIEAFKSLYSGSMLIAEKQIGSGENDYVSKHRKESLNKMRVPFIIICIVILVVNFLLLQSLFITKLSWQIWSLIFFKTLGLITSILLLIQSIDNNNPLVQKLCGDNNDNRDCNAILSSKAAKISEEVSWSEVGFFYFAGTWIVLLFNTGKINVIELLTLLNLVSLPYTIYSIYYQWRVAKQWCKFCCIIQALLWLEFFTLRPYSQFAIHFINPMDCSKIIIEMILPVLAWIFIKPYLLKAIQLQPLKQQLHNFKYNNELFHKLLNDEVKYALPSEKISLIIGNPAAKNVITMVSDPYCPPCADAHKKLEWISSREDVKLQIIFRAIDHKNPSTQTVSHFFTLKADQNELLKFALDDWYDQKQKNYETWKKKYPVKKMIDCSEVLEQQLAWYFLTGVNGTPTIFLNGRQIPSNYLPEDIKYFI